MPRSVADSGDDGGRRGWRWTAAQHARCFGDLCPVAFSGFGAELLVDGGAVAGVVARHASVAERARAAGIRNRQSEEADGADLDHRGQVMRNPSAHSKILARLRAEKNREKAARGFRRRVRTRMHSPTARIMIKKTT